jgi:hypothetical protein
MNIKASGRPAIPLPPEAKNAGKTALLAGAFAPPGRKKYRESEFHGFRDARQRRRFTRGYNPPSHPGRKVSEPTILLPI